MRATTGSWAATAERGRRWTVGEVGEVEEVVRDEVHGRDRDQRRRIATCDLVEAALLTSETSAQTPMNAAKKATRTISIEAV
jgi:hypothetical protein